MEKTGNSGVTDTAIAIAGHSTGQSTGHFSGAEKSPVGSTPALVAGMVDMALSGIHSPHTLRVYRAHLNRFLLSGYSLTRIGVQEWIRQTYGQSAGRGPISGSGGGSGSGMGQALAAVRKLADEALAHGVLGLAEWSGIKGVRGWKQKGVRVGNWLTLHEVTALLRVPDNSSMGVRDRAVLAVMVGCGLRREEVAGARTGGYKEVGGRKVMEVVGKGGKVRTVPVPVWVVKAVDKWLEVVWQHPPQISAVQYVATHKEYHSSALFRTFKGTGGEVGEGGLGPQGVYWLVRGYGERVGKQELRPHDLRRTFAKLAREGGAEMDQVSKVLGHSSVVVTERYLGGGVELREGMGAGDYIRVTA